MSEVDLEIPPPFDRRPNGRGRAYWMAHESCPPNRNRHEYAMENWMKFWERAKKLDAVDGLCRPLGGMAPWRRTMSKGESVQANADAQTRVRQKPPARRRRMRPD